MSQAEADKIILIDGPAHGKLLMITKGVQSVDVPIKEKRIYSFGKYRYCKTSETIIINNEERIVFK